jgi:hypothetical protein
MTFLNSKTALALAMCIPCLASCSKEATPSPEPPTAKQAAESAPTTAGEAPAEAKSSWSESNFSLSIQPAGEYAKGTAASVEIVLEAKAPFHANDKYPYKFKVADSPGLTFADKIVTKDKAKLEHMKVTMPVAFTPDDSGKRKISGLFQFSVCSEDKCLIERRNLALDVDVK